jgi:hypothetical protein
MADDEHGSTHSHLVDFPEALEAFFSRVGELRVVLGPGSADGVARLEALMQQGLAARDRGDMAAATARIVQAMDLLAELATGAPGLDGQRLRAMAEHFRGALARGSLGEAKAAADVMREQSGARLTPKKPR